MLKYTTDSIPYIIFKHMNCSFAIQKHGFQIDTPYGGGMTVCKNGTCHMAKLTGTPTYASGDLLKSSSAEPECPVVLGPRYKALQICTLQSLFK